MHPAHATFSPIIPIFIHSFMIFLGVGGLREHEDDSRGLSVPHGQEEEKVLCKQIFTKYTFYQRSGRSMADNWGKAGGKALVLGAAKKEEGEK